MTELSKVELEQEKILREISRLETDLDWFIETQFKNDSKIIKELREDSRDVEEEKKSANPNVSRVPPTLGQAEMLVQVSVQKAQRIAGPDFDDKVDDAVGHVNEIKRENELSLAKFLYLSEQ